MPGTRADVTEQIVIVVVTGTTEVWTVVASAGQSVTSGAHLVTVKYEVEYRVVVVATSMLWTTSLARWKAKMNVSQDSK